MHIAHRRRIIGENVATLVDPPTVDETETNPFTIEEAKAFLEAAAKRPTFMRWVVGVGMGFRQGEALGPSSGTCWSTQPSRTGGAPPRAPSGRSTTRVSPGRTVGQRPARRLGGTQRADRRGRNRRPAPARRKPPHRRHDPEHAGRRPAHDHGDSSALPDRPDPPLRQGKSPPRQDRRGPHGGHFHAQPRICTGPHPESGV